MDAKTTLAIVVILAVVAGVALLAARPGDSNEGGGIVAVTFPGISDDVKLVVEGCDNIRVETIAPPGVDPHEYNLEPSKVKLIEDAVLVVSTGHAPFEARVQEIAGNKTIVVPEIPGIKLLKTPTGAVNKHMPIYDPANYKVFAQYTARALEEKFPECRDTIEANLAGIIERIDRIIENYTGILQGRPAVLSNPVGQYAVSWLGPDIKVLLIAEHGSQASPEALEEAARLLSQGGVAVVVYAGDRPVAKSGEWLEEKAVETGAPVIKVPAPFTPGPILEKIEYVASQAARLTG